MHRDLAEIVASQRAMLARLERRGGRLDDGALMQAYTRHLVRARAWPERHRDIAVLAVNYADAVADPEPTASRLAGFFGAPFDPGAAAATVDPTLQRQRRRQAPVAAGPAPLAVAT
jgi:Sulfotransferase family